MTPRYKTTGEGMALFKIFKKSTKLNKFSKSTDVEVVKLREKSQFYYRLRKFVSKDKAINASKNEVDNKLLEVDHKVRSMAYATEQADILYKNKYAVLEDLVEEVVEEIVVDGANQETTRNLSDTIKVIARQVNGMTLKHTRMGVLPTITEENMQSIAADLNKVREMSNGATSADGAKKDRVTKKTIKDSVLKAEKRLLNADKACYTQHLMDVYMQKLETEEPYLEEGKYPASYVPFPATTIDKDIGTEVQDETTVMGMTEEQQKQMAENPISKFQYSGTSKTIKSLNKHVHKARWIKFYERLTRYLNIKYHMSIRNYTTYRYMMQDARTWMLKNSFTCDSEFDYVFMTTSVNAAFVVQPEELETREIIKDVRNLNAMRKINEFAGGDLGHIPSGGLSGIIRRAIPEINVGESVRFDAIPNVKC